MYDALLISSFIIGYSSEPLPLNAIAFEVGVSRGKTFYGLYPHLRSLMA